MNTTSEALYERIGQNYDTTRRADPMIAQNILKLLKPTKRGRYLDVGCGSGNYTIKLAEGGLAFDGIDPSLTMLERAREKSSFINWYEGSAETLPFGDSAYEGAVCTLAIHHFHSLEKSFSEIARVIGNGALVIFTADQDQMKNYWLNAYFPKMMAKAIAQMPSFDDVSNALKRSGFSTIATKDFFVEPQLQDFFLYSGKHKPEIYLQKHVRDGISSFASLADANEVIEGCEKLKGDLRSGKFDSIKNKFSSKIGDYLFIVANKTVE